MNNEILLCFISLWSPKHTKKGDILKNKINPEISFHTFPSFSPTCLIHQNNSIRHFFVPSFSRV